jgi:redox-sensitive bicupin YhaK (pirin superfamily)
VFARAVACGADLGGYDLVMANDIEQILDARPREVGGFTVGRVLPAAARRAVGPFVFFDHMGPADAQPGFAIRPHPHLHLATVTYLFAGEVMHRDSLGSEQLITPGAINWMTAGTGIVHSERAPAVQTARDLHGLQLWVGLPKAVEDSAPAFEHTPASALPQVDDAGAAIRILAGSAFGATSPVRTLSSLFYVEVRLSAGARVPVPAEHVDRALYVAEGTVRAGDTRLEARRMAVFTRGSTPVIVAETDARIVMLGGDPLDGPRYIWWNFVSSSQERILEAAHAWRERKFPVIPSDDREFIPAPDDDPRFAQELP